MKPQIEKANVDALVAQFPEPSNLREPLRLAPRVEIPCARLNGEQLRFLRQRYEAGGLSMAGRAAQLLSFDEAIVSRCIAMIRYHPPGFDDRARVSRVMAAQFGLALDEPLVAALASRFPDASGRDIQGLARLTAKYCRRKALDVTLDAFLSCAVFRGMDAVREPAP